MNIVSDSYQQLIFMLHPHNQPHNQQSHTQLVANFYTDNRVFQLAGTDINGGAA